MCRSFPPLLLWFQRTLSTSNVLCFGFLLLEIFSLYKCEGALLIEEFNCPFIIDNKQWYCSIKQEYHWIKTGKLIAKRQIHFANPEPSQNTLQIWNINLVGRGNYSPVSFSSNSVQDSFETVSPLLLISSRVVCGMGCLLGPPTCLPDLLDRPLCLPKKGQTGID